MQKGVPSMVQELVKILIVDDEFLICELLDEFLSERGYQVAIANNGEEAIRRFKTERPSLVLLDMRMPKMTGLDVLRRIKEIDDKAKVVMLTAMGDDESMQRADELGASDYMLKPIDLESLEAGLTHLLNSGRVLP